MREFQTVSGFEELLRGPVGSRTRPQSVLSASDFSGAEDLRSRLARLSTGAPEAIFKITGRTRDVSQLRAQLSYISRRGALDLEDRNGGVVRGRDELRELADDWSATARFDRRRRWDTPFSRSVVLSSPAQSDPGAVQDAARHLALKMLADRFDYVFALHTDSRHPHVHLSIRALGDHGERLRFIRSDLGIWRQEYARALRMRGIEVEATPRAARGLMPKAESTAMRKVDDLYMAGKGPMARVHRQAYREAAAAAFLGDTELRPWEAKVLERQVEIRALYLAQAKLLRQSADPKDRALGDAVLEFVRRMPAPEAPRLGLAKELIAADTKARAIRAIEGEASAEIRQGRTRPERKAELER